MASILNNSCSFYLFPYKIFSENKTSPNKKVREIKKVILPSPC